MSSSSSSSSRQVSPSIHALVPMNRRTKKPKMFGFDSTQSLLFTVSCIIFIFGLLTYLQASKPFYCVDGLNKICRKCPDHATCSLTKVINCHNNTEKYHESCLHMSNEQADQKYQDLIFEIDQLTSTEDYTTKETDALNLLQSRNRYYILSNKIYRTPKFGLYLSTMALVVSTLYAIVIFLRLD